MVRVQGVPISFYPSGLSVYSSHKSSSNVFKLLYGIIRTENGMYKVDGSCTETHKKLKDVTFNV